MPKPKLVLKGDKELIAKLKRLGNRRLFKKVIRQATNAAAQIVVKAVKERWPEESGLSKRSVVKKIISTKAGYSAIIGIDKEAQQGTHIPSNIDHLIELGWQTPEGTTVPAIAPLRRGYEASSDTAKARFAEKAASAIEKEAVKRGS